MDGREAKIELWQLCRTIASFAPARVQCVPGEEAEAPDLGQKIIDYYNFLPHVFNIVKEASNDTGKFLPLKKPRRFKGLTLPVEWKDYVETLRYDI